jgi:hypothetical protein
VDLKRANNVGKYLSRRVCLDLNNLGVLLARMKVSNSQIREALENLDDKTLSLENAKALCGLVPSDEEVDSCSLGKQI